MHLDTINFLKFSWRHGPKIYLLKLDVCFAASHEPPMLPYVSLNGELSQRLAELKGRSAEELSFS